LTAQKKHILESAEFLKTKNPFKSPPRTAIITYRNASFLSKVKVTGKIKFHDVPSFCKKNEADNENEIMFASSGKTNLIILNGRYNYYNGCSMRTLAHPVYVLNSLGVKSVILIDEAGYLNPRFKTGGIALIYDHINLMGDNPLIGENDSTIGTRFPDMSDAYDASLYSKTEELFLGKQFRFYPSVYLGIPGPETETEAECRFYREIGSDVLGYSLVPENLAAVHCGLKCLAFGMLSRELVADRLKEISPKEQSQNRLKAEKEFSKVIRDLVNVL